MTGVVTPIPTTGTNNRRRVATAVGVACVLVGVIAYQASATFDGASSDSHSVTTANLTLSASGSAFSTDVTGLTPGVEGTRAITLNPGGTGDIGGVHLTTVATSSSALDTDATNGLQLSIERCSVAWGGTADAYTCGGSTTTVLASRAVIVNDISLTNVDTSVGAHNYLVVHLKLADTADSTFESLSSTIQFTFTAVQRANTAR